MKLLILLLLVACITVAKPPPPPPGMIPTAPPNGNYGTSRHTTKKLPDTHKEIIRKEEDYDHTITIGTPFTIPGVTQG